MRVSGDRLISVATTFSVVAVAGFAAIVSYSHFYDLCLAHGQDGTAARLTPLSVDLLILAVSLVLLYAARKGITAPWPLRAVLMASVAVTVAGNALYGITHGAVGAVLSSLPGFAFVAAVETLMWLVRAGKVSPVSPPSPVSLPGDNVELAQRAYAATLAAGNPLTQNQLQQKYRLTRAQASRVRKGPSSAALTVDPPQAGPRLPSPSGPLVPVNGHGRVHA